MSDRRPLVQGVAPVNAPKPPMPSEAERRFVYGEKKQSTVVELVREPISTRLRGDLAKALKRAVLERKLAGESPDTVQEILDDALEPWLRAHGYLND